LENEALFDKIDFRVIIGGYVMAKGKGKVIAQNRKASHDYFIEETYEAGIVLQGTEIKSIRAGRVSIKDAHARIDSRGEVQLINMHIAAYEQGNRYNHDPTRTRKLLLHRHQIDKLIGLTQQKGYALVPLRVYIKNGFAKLLLGVGRGKKQYDKREDLKRKQMKRDADRAIKEYNR
jgi:SsrA-binding protein